MDIAGFQEVPVEQLEDLKVRLPEMDVYGVERDDGENAGEFAPIYLRGDRFDLVASVVSPSDGNLFCRADRCPLGRRLFETNETIVPQKIPFLRDTTLV